MDTSLEDGLPRSPLKLPVTDAPDATAEAATIPYDLPKAARYSVANYGASVIYSLFNFAMPLYLATYHLNPSLIGLLANERSFVGAFVQPVVGRLSDRTRSPLGRRRPFFLVGIPLMCLALFVLALHPPLWAVIAVMAVAAFFLSVAWDPYMAMMADLFPQDQRGRVGGLVGVASGVGTIIFLLIAKSLWEHNEFVVFLLSIVLLAATWAYTFFTVKEPPLPAEAPVAKLRPDLRAYVRKVAEYPEAAKYTLAMTFFWLGTGGSLPFITLFGVKALGATEEESFILPLVAVVMNALFAAPAGYLADRISKKRVMTVGLILFGVAGLLGSQSQSLLQATLALGFIGLANAAMAQVNPMLTDLVPRKRTAEFVGLGSAVFSLAQPVGSVLAGAVVSLALLASNEASAYRWSFIFSAAMVLLAAVLLQRVRPERAALD